MRHEAAWLRDYLVAGVEDPRINVQSVILRHFLIQALADERFGALMQQEYRFAAVMNWLLGLAPQLGDGEQIAAVLHALRRNADDAEGTEIPHFVLRTFGELPATVGSLTVPNYVERIPVQRASHRWPRQLSRSGSRYLSRHLERDTVVRRIPCR